jgi:multiple sugar transport system ATP-binding protein
MTLDVVEPMGNEIILYAHPPALDVTVVARIEPQEVPPVGEPVELALDLEKLHFFDADTGAAIARDAPAHAAS